MALPKLNTPIHELTLPSTGKEVKYRPFLVKEQKLLLMALESKEQKEMMRAMKQIINNCAIDKIDVDQLPMFDLEYFFIKLRAKSVGEIIELQLTHPNETNSDIRECKHVTKFKLNLMDVEVQKDAAHSNKIIIDEEKMIGVCLKYPTMALADKMQLVSQKSQIESVLDLVAESIDYIYDKDNVYPAKETSKKELLDFVNDLSQDQFRKLTDFFGDMPKLKHTLKWTCAECGCEDSVEVEGMANFFG